MELLTLIYNFLTIPGGILAIAWVLPAAMAAAGLAKSFVIDAPKAERQRRLAAETQRWSPWTDMKPGPVEEADPFGSAFKYGSTGLALGQGLESFEAGKELQKARLEDLKLDSLRKKMLLERGILTDPNPSKQTAYNPWNSVGSYTV